MTVDPSTVPIRPAATVVLLRDGADGLEVWLQQRATTLVFAAGMWAFPGGAVDSADFAAELPKVDVAAHAVIWGDGNVQSAHANLAAAIRETHEESGITLRPTALVPWSRWVTPVGDVRRFDARFFLAPSPRDQFPEALTGEVATARWFVVGAAVEAFSTGALPMWPPTISTLVELVPFDHVAAVLAAAPTHIQAVTE